MSYDIDRVHEEMLEIIGDEYQKTVGFPTYDITRAFARAICSLGDDTDIAVGKTNVDNLTGEELTRWCSQRRGIVRTAAVAATGQIKIVSGSGTITTGNLFESDGGIQFRATETKSVHANDTVRVEAVVPGSSGNVVSGSVTRMPVTIQGIATVTNPAAMSGGYDAETDEALRARYYFDLKQSANGANANSYLVWALSVSGVGHAKVFPLANGVNTVEVCIIGSDMEPAASSLVAAVQNYIDPGSTGTGQGQAPMGAICTVTTATALNINVACHVTLESGYTVQTVLNNVKAKIQDYLHGIAFVSNYVSYARIADAVMDAEGVDDYEDLTVNGGTNNITIGARQVAVMGTVTIS